MADLAQLTRMIEPEAQALGFDLVRVKLFGAAGDVTLQVMAERPDTRQLTIEDCTRLSHRISDLLDETDPIESEYRLEVSSPGIDRPLTRLKDYADWTGHEARLQLVEKIDGRKQLTGVIQGVAGERVTIDVRNHQPMTVAFDRIADAKLLLTDALIAATQPLSAEGADEMDDFDEDLNEDCAPIGADMQEGQD